MGNGLGPEVEDRTAPSEQVILPAWHLSEISAQTSRKRQALIFCIVCRIASLLSPLPSSDQIKLNQGLHWPMEAFGDCNPGAVPAAGEQSWETPLPAWRNLSAWPRVGEPLCPWVPGFYLSSCLQASLHGLIISEVSAEASFRVINQHPNSDGSGLLSPAAMPPEQGFLVLSMPQNMVPY